MPFCRQELDGTGSVPIAPITLISRPSSGRYHRPFPWRQTLRDQAMPDLASLRRSLRVAIKALAPYCRKPIEFKLARRATPQEIRQLERKIGRKLPPGLARLFGECSASIEFIWHASKKIPVPVELHGIRLGVCIFSLEMVETNVVNWSGWEDCFAHPEDYGGGEPRFAFDQLFPILSTGNGDALVTVVKGPKKGEVYYLNHEGGEMDWACLAKTLPDFLVTWFGLGCPGPEYEALLPFFDSDLDLLSHQLPESRAWRRTLGLDGKPPQRVAVLDRPATAISAPVRADEILYPVHSKKTCGYINRSGQLVLTFRQASLGRFQEGRASIAIRDRHGFIDRAGGFVVKPQYQWVGDFFEGRAQVRNDDMRYGFVDRDGKLVIPVKYDSAGDFCHGRAYVKIQNKYGYVNSEGDFIIDPIYDNATDFSEEGFAKVWVSKKAKFIDLQGKTVAKGSQRARELGLSPNVKFVKKKDKYVFVDRRGKVLSAQKFDDCYGFSEGLGRVNIGAKIEYMYPGSSYSSLSGGKWGFIDEQGNVVAEPAFDTVKEFSEGRAAVAIQDRWGYIDHKGKMVIEPRFKDAESFYEGLAYVDFGKQITGYIDVDGNPVWRSN
jgi:hypothetical protein